MNRCEQVLSQSALYVDGELSPAARASIDAHLAECPECRDAIASECEGREALVACRAGLRACAPEHLRRAIIALSRERDAAAGRSEPGRRWARVPLAATLTLACAGAVAYGLFSRAGTAVAAQLALDHFKCVRLAAARHAPERLPEAAAAWERHYGWRVVLPSEVTEAGFEFVMLRRCLHGQGLIAHALYRRGDHFVSFFVFPRDVQTTGVLEIMGERASLWSQGAQTYAAVGRVSAAELDQFVALARADVTDRSARP